MNLRNTYSAGC